MNIRKAVIPAAGLGTRLLTATKEQPKEMLPVFFKGRDIELGIKPVVQLIFEQLFDCGFREFCFIVGRGKRTIEDHFTPDHEYIQTLTKSGKTTQSEELQSFYDKIQSSTILWINQSSPKGFGDAVLCARSFCNEPFLVHAGDTYIISNKNNHIARLLSAKNKANTTLILKRIKDPRKYGVAKAKEIDPDTFLITEVEEKPQSPKSDLALMPVYLFNPSIFEYLDNLQKGKGGEYQLTDAIQKSITSGEQVLGTTLHEGEIMLDIGTPDSYWEALQRTYSLCTGVPKYL